MAEPVLSVVGTTITGGNGNGRIDPNECNNLSIVITNEGLAAATRVQGTLVSLTPGVLLGQASAAYPDLPGGLSAVNETPSRSAPSLGSSAALTVVLQFVIKCDQTIQTNIIQLASGVLGSAVTFANPNPVAVPSGSLTECFLAGDRLGHLVRGQSYRFAFSFRSDG